MARYITLIVFIILFLSLQLGFFSGWTIFGGTVNLIVLVLVTSFFLGIEKEGLIISLFLAFFYDLYFYSFLGISIIVIILIYYLLIFLRNKISREPGYLTVLVAVFFASIIFDLAVLGGLAINFHLDFLYIFLYTILPNALLNLVIALPFYIIVRKIVSILKIYRIIGSREKRISVSF